MDAMAMVRVAFWIFAVAAAGGLLMAGIRLAGNRNPPIAIAYVHGLLAGAGLTLLLYAVIAGGIGGRAATAAWILLAAAAGGSALNLLYHWRQQPLPKGLMFGHIALALLGVGLLYTAAF